MDLRERDIKDAQPIVPKGHLVTWSYCAFAHWPICSPGLLGSYPLAHLIFCSIAHLAARPLGHLPAWTLAHLPLYTLAHLPARPIAVLDIRPRGREPFYPYAQLAPCPVKS